MKRVRPADVRRQIIRERRQRRIAHLSQRRPGSTRLEMLQFTEVLAGITDSLRETVRPAVAETVRIIERARAS